MEFKDEKILENAKALVISHADLDGIGSAFLAKQYIMTKYNEYAIYCHMSPVADVTNKILDEYAINHNPEVVEEIYILDRASNEETISKINKYYQNAKLRIVDHHISQKSFYDQLADDSNVNLHVNYSIATTKIFGEEWGNEFSYFASVVDLWDTFKWKTFAGPESQLALKLNAYACMLGPSVTYKIFCNNSELLRKGDITSLPGFDIIYSAYQNKIAETVEVVEKKMILMDLSSKDIDKCVIAYLPYQIDGSLLSIVFNNILDGYKTYNNLDPVPTLIFTVNDNGIISARSHKDSPISALEFVKSIDPNGGGHPQAAGGNISIGTAHRNLLNEMLFSSKSLNETDLVIKNHFLPNSGKNVLYRSGLSVSLNQFLASTEYEVRI